MVLVSNKEMSKKNNFSRFNPSHNEIKGYSDPQLVIGKETYVFFYAFDPVSGLRKRKKYMLGRCKTKKELMRTSKFMINTITRKLEAGCVIMISSISG